MVLLLAVCGLFVSVLVNGLADTLPSEESRAFPSWLLPRCRYCGSTRKPLDLSAVFSSLFESGGCLRCGAPRRFRDLLVEMILLIAFPAVWLLGRTSAPDLLWAGFVLASFLLFLIIDFEHRSVFGAVVGLVALVLVLFAGARGFPAFFRALGGGLAGFLIFLFLYLLGGLLGRLFHLGQGIEPLGFGDVILAGVVGVATGWPSILAAVLLSILLAGIAGLVLLIVSILRGESPGNATMAYGPYLMISGLIICFYGGPFLQWLLNSLTVF
jgi:leader peptidase (prepilin peptidase)/N-methyltransferase